MQTQKEDTMTRIDFDLGDEGINDSIDGFLNLGISSLGCCLVQEINQLVGENDAITKMIQSGGKKFVLRWKDRGKGGD